MITFNLLFLPPSGARGLYIMHILLISALLMGGCNTHDPIATPVANADYSIIDGDTVKTVKTKDFDKIYKYDNNSKKYITVGDTIVTYREPKLHTPPAKDPDLTKIKNDKEPTLKGQPLKMIVVGGSMSAGVRDGGYFNEGILTSYTNLIARQMKLKKFEQPLFDATQYNGIGRKVKTGFNPTGGPIQKFNVIQNNLTGDYLPDEQYDYKKIKLPDYKGDPDNLAVPFNSRSFITVDGVDNSFKKRIVTAKNNFGKDISVLSHLKTRKFDFFILETGIDDLIKFAHNEGGDIWATNVPIGAKDYTFQDILSYEEDIRIQPELRLIKEVLAPLSAKGVMFNIPDVLDFPYFLSKNYVLDYDPVVKEALLSRYGSDRFYCFKPSSKIDSLLSRKVHPALKPVINGTRLLATTDFISNNVYDSDLNDLQLGTKRMNDQLINFNKKYGYGIVDIRSLYKKIASREGFNTDDGILINIANFFSNDGINPTILGQVVIANEVIKTINLTYKVDIPLISVREYLNVK